LNRLADGNEGSKKGGKKVKTAIHFPGWALVKVKKYLNRSNGDYEGAKTQMEQHSSH
jgi:hypothetical protein